MKTKFVNKLFKTNQSKSGDIIGIKIFSIAKNVWPSVKYAPKVVNANISKTLRVLEKIYTEKLDTKINLVFRICPNIFLLTSAHNQLSEILSDTNFKTNIQMTRK